YPAEWAKDVRLDDRTYHVRPIRPEDAALYPDFLAKTSPDDIRSRFLGARADIPDKMLVRLTQLDYDREMAFVALDGETGALCGIARLSADPDHEMADYAILVRSDLQGRGLGWAMLHRLIDYAKADGLERIEGFVLSGNAKMLKMCGEIGFRLVPDTTGVGITKASLVLADLGRP
ncbi:N-acetyltransferase family protein, partial [Mesorhizobium sp.]|uniref:GNAT family N-acetyltransferase n=1 Tax=Mesorhizobium sp. TaxID=1871066 RepID=UPI0035656620